MLSNLYKTRFFNKKYTFTICVGCVCVVIVVFLLEKQTFNGLLKVIGIQITLFLQDVQSTKKLMLPSVILTLYLKSNYSYHKIIQFP